MSDHPLSAALPFDHRASIVAYLEGVASKLELQKRGEDASLIRAQASSIAAEIDIVPGVNGISSAGHAVAREIAARLGGTNAREILGTDTTKAAVRARYAAIYVLRQRMNWTQERIGKEIGDRNPSSISSALQRAEEMRGTDPEFKALTDELGATSVVCENCQHPLT